jgi:hypothetical protein
MLFAININSLQQLPQLLHLLGYFRNLQGQDKHGPVGPVEVNSQHTAPSPNTAAFCNARMINKASHAGCTQQAAATALAVQLSLSCGLVQLQSRAALVTGDPHSMGPLAAQTSTHTLAAL